MRDAALLLFLGATACASEVIHQDGDGATNGAGVDVTAASSGIGGSTTGSGSPVSASASSSASLASTGDATSTGASGGGGASGDGGSSVGPGGGGLPGEISDVFDPAEVYLLGSVSPGSAGRDAMAHWSDPNTAAIGFIGAYDSYSLRMQGDGKLIYVLAGEVREFVCDACPYVGEYENGSDSNDPFLPMAPCVPDDWIDGVKVRPEGSWVHSCSEDGNKHWYDPDGVLVYGDEEDLLVHLGYSNLALTEERVVDLAHGTSVPIAGLPGSPLLAVRAVAPDAFHLVLQGSGEGAAELWEVGSTGTATLVGAYPPVPDGYTVTPFPSLDHALDASDALLQIGTGPVEFEDVIIRREIGGSSTVAYDEATNPLVQIHISRLVTGP